MNLIQTLEQEEIARLGKVIPAFAPGDTVIVSVNVIEGTRKRVQAYEGVVVARRNRGLNSSFIVRKISSGEGVERTFPLYSPYHATKWAVDGFSESLHYELARFGVRVKVVEPGVIHTDFYERSADTHADDGVPEIYKGYAQTVRTNLTPDPKTGSSPEQVAAVVFRAATDGSKRLRYVAGGDAKQLLWLRKLLPDALFFKVIAAVVERGAPPV